MKKQTKIENTTITVSQEVWKELQMIKIRGGYANLDAVLKVMLEIE